MHDLEAWRRAAALAIFLATYAVMAVGRIPGFRIDRSGAAFLGAALMVASGSLSLPAAFHAIDLSTITLLLGMMIVVANLQLAGFFQALTARIAGRIRRPLALLGAVVLVSGVLSAFLVNDAVCLALAPLVLEIVLRLRRNPAPYLLALAMAANVGGVATITGNPQNMIIGSLSGIPYGWFVARLAPVAALGLVLTFALIALLFRAEFRGGVGPFEVSVDTPLDRPLALKTLLVTALLIVAFFAGVAPAKAAALAGGALLLSRRVEARRIYAVLDWKLLLMFAGLFIVVAGFGRAFLTPAALASIARLPLSGVGGLSAVAAVLSNIVSNVPAVLLLAPFVPHLADPGRSWLVLAMASTFAGNFTIVGSIANLIVVECARARGVRIGFGAYFLVGAPLTLATIAVGAALL